NRRRHTRLAAQADDRAAEPRKLQGPAALEILQHRGLRLRWQVANHRQDLIHQAAAEGDLFRARDSERLFERAAEHREEIGVASYRTDRRSRDRAHPAQDGESDELLPEIDLDPLAQRRIETR